MKFPQFMLYFQQTTFQFLVFIISYYKILSIIPYAIKQGLLFICFTCHSLYLLIQNSQFTPPHLFSLVTLFSVSVSLILFYKYVQTEKDKQQIIHLYVESKKNYTNELNYLLEKFKTAVYGRSSCELHICKDVIHMDCDLNDELDLCNVQPA